MGRFGKFGCLCLMVLLILCIGRKTDASEIAVAVIFPNLAELMDWGTEELPITAETESTVVEIQETQRLPIPDTDNELREQLAEENQLSFATLLEEEETSQLTIPEEVVEVVYTEEQLKDYDFLISRLYNVDSSTKTSPQQLNVERLLSYDFQVDKETDGAQILIYHTHSQETFVDSIPGDEGTSIVGMGSYLTTLLQQQGFKVIHNKDSFDMVDGQLDRNKAYTRAEPVITQILAENPTIQIVIDLHRDGVGENVHLVKEIDGKPTAQVMFFNGLSYSAKNGNIDYLPNPYIENNLALTMQMKLASDSLVPGFARKVYLKSLRFNLHLHPGAMLIEAGAQTNTVEEMRNAMEVLARVLGDVLY
ncbi:MAG: stage II sporulation protein P [Lachnospiraceae bacterium]|nr:stage II sporulation protein P [Lachnospiraceae bacterium]